MQEEDFTLQENFYFDTPDFALRSLKSALRVRKKAGGFQLTLKTPEHVGLLETNQLIGEEDFQHMITGSTFPEGEVYEKLAVLGVPAENLEYFGTLATKRAETGFKGGILVFDHNFYLNKEDFELEYEVSSLETGTKHFITLLDQYGIPYHPAKSKVLRFYETKLKEQ